MTTEKKPRKPRAKKEQIEQPQPQVTQLQLQKLTLDTILDETKKYDELVVITLEGVGYTEIYKHFSPTKIEKMLEDIATFLDEYQKNIGEVTEKEIGNYINIFILLHFSTLVEKLPETWEEKADIYAKILNSEIAEKVAESFDKNEIAKINERMFKKFEALQEIAKSNVEVRNQLRNYVKNSKLENKDILLNALFDQDTGVDESGE